MRMFVGAALAALLVLGCRGPVGQALPAPSSQEAAATQDAAVASGCSLPDVNFDLRSIDDDGDAPDTLSGQAQFPLSSSGLITTIAKARDAGAAIQEPPKAPLDLPLQGVIVKDSGDAAATGGSTGIVTLYYATRPLRDDDTFESFVGGGGAIVSEQRTTGQDADLVLKTVGEKLATAIAIGPYPAALVHSTPYGTGAGTGFRTWSVWWSDGTTDFAVAVDGPAAAAIETAQSFYCPN